MWIQTHNAYTIILLLTSSYLPHYLPWSQLVVSSYCSPVGSGSDCGLWLCEKSEQV